MYAQLCVHVCVCVCVCMHVCVHVCVCVCVCVHVCVSMSVCRCVHVSVFVCTSLCAGTCVASIDSHILLYHKQLSHKIQLKDTALQHTFKQESVCLISDFQWCHPFAILILGCQQDVHKTQHAFLLRCFSSCTVLLACFLETRSVQCKKLPRCQRKSSIHITYSTQVKTTTSDEAKSTQFCRLTTRDL